MRSESRSGHGSDSTARAGDVRGEALRVENISKSFGAVQALRGVSLALEPGETLALVGDNGAGKSTLVKCISGVLRPDTGRILVNGEPVEISNPLHARRLGIETVYQDLALVETMDVASNLFLNREVRHRLPGLRHLGLLDHRGMRQQSKEILDRLHINIPSVRKPVTKLSGGQRQAIAIGRAVGWGRSIVLLDEPAAALGVEQAQHVLDLVKRLGNEGVAVLLISHNMQHVVEACQRAVVLRHGRKVGDVKMADVTARDLVDLITGAASGDEPDGGADNGSDEEAS